MFEWQNNEIPDLNEETASAIMANVFEACGKTPSTVPLSVLSSYTQYRRDRYALQKWILIFVLTVFLLLPLCFVAPKFQVEQIGRYETGVPTYEVRVSNWLPVRLVSARLNDRPVAVYESQAKIFTVEPRDNGKLTITVTLANRQYDIWSTTVEGVDAVPPTLVSSEAEPEKIRIYLDDAGVGINFEEIYAVSANDPKIAPLDYNVQEKYVDFLFPTELNIFVPDYNGNTLQLVLSIRPSDPTPQS